MTHPTTHRAFATSCLLLALTGMQLVGIGVSEASAQIAVTPPELEPVDVEEHLNAPIPLDAHFTDQNGKKVRLRDLVDGKRPTVLTMAYHSCPVLCSMVLGATVNGLKEVGWSLGDEYNALTISIDPRDTAEDGARKRAQMLGLYGREQATKESPAWPFLVGDKANIEKVANAVGFKYHYDRRQQQYAHPSVVMILKPTGEVARYLYGLQFNPNDLRLGLLEASQGRSMTTLERVILYCYMYDPIGAKYAIVATKVMQVGGVIIVVLLSTFLIVLWRRDMLGKYRTATNTSAAIADANPTADNIGFPSSGGSPGEGEEG